MLTLVVNILKLHQNPMHHGNHKWEICAVVGLQGVILNLAEHSCMATDAMGEEEEK